MPLSLLLEEKVPRNEADEVIAEKQLICAFMMLRIHLITAYGGASPQGEAETLGFCGFLHRVVIVNLCIGEAGVAWFDINQVPFFLSACVVNISYTFATRKRHIYN